MTDSGKCLSRRPREASIPPTGRFSFVPPPLIRSYVSWRGRDLRAEERDDAYPVSAAGDSNGDSLADLIAGTLGALTMTGATVGVARPMSSSDAEIGNPRAGCGAPKSCYGR